MAKILSLSRKRTSETSSNELKQDFVEKKTASGLTVKVKVNNKTKAPWTPKKNGNSFEKKGDGKKTFKDDKKVFKKYNKKIKKKKDDKLLILDERITFDKFFNRDSVQEALKLLRLFGERFDFNNPKPMAKDMFKVARERLKTMQLPISNLMLRRAFKFYAESPKYAETYVVGAMRYDLDGNPTTPITQEELTLANEMCRQTRKTVQFKAKKAKERESSARQGKQGK